MSAAVGTAALAPGALVVWMDKEFERGFTRSGVVVRSATADGLVLVERFRQIEAVPEASLMVYAKSYDEFAAQYDNVVMRRRG